MIDDGGRESASINYGPDYYGKCFGKHPYVRGEPHWQRFFGGIADEIARALAPRRVFDAGCAIGFLVEALWDRGIEAWGRDISEFAISEVRRDIQPFCSVGSLTEPLPSNYDLVTCIEVLEHLREGDAVTAIGVLSSAAPRILFSSSPIDVTEATHVNVKPAIWWLQQFAAVGFAPSFTFDATFLCPWAVLFERREDGRDERTLVGFAELVRTRLRLFELNRIAGDNGVRAELAEQRLREAKATMEREKNESRTIAEQQLRETENAAERRLHEAEARAERRVLDSEQALHEARRQLALIRGSRSWRAAKLLGRAAGIALSPARAALGRSGESLRFRERRALRADLALLHGSALFDASYYRERYPDVVTADIEPALHYLLHGASEGRDPSADFSTSEYLALNPDVVAAGHNPLLHYLRHGQGEGRPVRAKALHEHNRWIDHPWPTLHPLHCYPVPSCGERRLSIITDSVGSASLFGGVGTALVLGTLLANRLGANLRLITRTEPTDGEPFAQVLRANRIELSGGLETAFAPVQNGRDLPVSDDDVFLTTSWWSTRCALRSVPRARIGYILQEDERMFYPHGDERLRCTELLAEGGFPIAVNTEMLFRYLTDGPDPLPKLAADGVWFEPAFPSSTTSAKSLHSGGKRRFFFYARPNNARNLFWRGLEVLAAVIEEGLLDPAEWDIYWVGKDVPKITLPHNVQPTLVQGLSWSDYQLLVHSMDAGLVLMDTPHPSYPPLDLAAAGVPVLTNVHRGKTDLSRYSANILLAPPTLDGLREGMARLITLAQDDEVRKSNRESDCIGRDWRIALEPVVQHFTSRWGL